MRIGIFTDTYFPQINGVSTSVYMLKKSLEEHNHTVYLVTTNDSMIKFDYDEKHKVLRIPSIPTGIYNYRLSRIYPIKVINQIKSWKLDVIHSHTEFGVGTFARLFAKQFYIPLVHTYHTWYEDYTYYLTKGHVKKASNKVVEYLTKFYCDTTATELIVPTKKIYDLFRQRYKFEKNINVIPTGIEIERFFKENLDKHKLNRLYKQFNISRHDFVIIWVGRLASEKNLEFIFNVHKSLVKKHPNIKLLLVGDGPERQKYEQDVAAIGLDKYTIFTGKVSWEEMPYFYNCADLYVTASKSETQGLTVIEAMSASVVPLCINDDAFSQTVIDGLNGRIFETEEDLINIIQELYHNNKERQYLSRQAKISTQKFSTKYFGEAVLDVYRRAIYEKNASKNIFNRLYDKIRKE